MTGGFNVKVGRLTLTSRKKAIRDTVSVRGREDSEVLNVIKLLPTSAAASDLMPVPAGILSLLPPTIQFALDVQTCCLRLGWGSCCLLCIPVKLESSTHFV